MPREAIQRDACWGCGAPFLDTSRGGSMTCSPECRTLYRKSLNIRPTLPELACQNCRRGFQPIRSDQLFCSSQCKLDEKNRAFKRGAEAYRALYHWVSCPSAERGKHLLELSQLARGWRDEDRLAQRKPPPPSARSRGLR